MGGPPTAARAGEAVANAPAAEQRIDALTNEPMRFPPSRFSWLRDRCVTSQRMSCAVEQPSGPRESLARQIASPASRVNHNLTARFAAPRCSPHEHDGGNHDIGEEQRD